MATPKGNRVRPTSDRVKEALFSILLSRYGSLSGLSVLDLFAGTGSLGIEALSRGAVTATFVDSHPQSLELIRHNLDLTGFANQAELCPMEVLKALQHLRRAERSFDVIFVDPPYRELALAQEVLELLALHRLTPASGLIVFETGGKTILDLPEELELLEKRVYGDTAIYFIGQ